MSGETGVLRNRSGEVEKETLLRGGSSPEDTPIILTRFDTIGDAASDAKIRRVRKALLGAVALCFTFMVGEFVCGILSHSLAILTDALHMLTDVVALSISLFAVVASRWRTSKNYTYGFHRAEVVGALGSVFLVWGLVGVILYEAGSRMYVIVKCAQHKESKYTECESIDAAMMLGVGCFGLISNISCALILAWGGHAHSHSHSGGGDHDHDHGHSHGASDGPFKHSFLNLEEDDDDDYRGDSLHVQDAKHEAGAHGHSHGDGGCGGGGHGHAHGGGHGHARGASEKNMNIRGAVVHAVGDCLQSIGVILAAGIIWLGSKNKMSDPHSYFNLADPICSLVFAAATVYATKGLFRDVLRILMERTPLGFPTHKLIDRLLALPDVVSVHDLHVWSISSSKHAMSVHIVSRSHFQTLKRATIVCHKFGFEVTTIQVDPADDDTDEEMARSASASVDIGAGVLPRVSCSMDTVKAECKKCTTTSA